jgi:Mor family transcriptional regulator
MSGNSMTDPVKRKLSAKEILADIRSGMDASELKRKYGLSDKSLEYVCNKLAAAGALTDKEGRRLGPLRAFPKGTTPP